MMKSNASGGNGFFMWIITTVAVFILSLLLCIPGMVPMLEQQLVFGPAPSTLDPQTHRPVQLDGSYVRLPQSGGAVFHYKPGSRTGRRRLLVIPGSSHPLDAFSPVFERTWALGYDLWALEYPGYGVCYNMSPEHRAKELSQLLVCAATEAWSVMGTPDAIVLGFSLGGLVLGQVYDTLQPPPAQIVFASTMASIEELEREKMWIPLCAADTLVYPFLTTRWCTKPPVRYRGRVVVAHGTHDDLIPIHHGHQIMQVFAIRSPTWVELPEGNHRTSALLGFDLFMNPNVLLSPVL